MLYRPEVIGHFIGNRRRLKQNDRKVFLRHQQKSLRNLLSQSRKYVPFYQQRIGKNLEYGEIPPSGKKEMMEAFSQTLNRSILEKLRITPEEVLRFAQEHDGQQSPWLQGKIRLSRTTGTSGRPAWKFSSKTEFWLGQARDFARNRGGKLSLLMPKRNPQRYALLGSSHGQTTGSSSTIVDMVKKRFSRQFEVRSFPHELSDQELAAALDEYQPYSISGYPLHLVRLAQMRLAGIGPKREPGRLATGADLLTRQHYELLRAAFPTTELVNTYASVECSPIARSCRLGHLHLNEDLVICEPVDENDKTLPLGVWSDAALVTSLSRFLHPTIRYRLADSVRIMPDPCPCESAYPVIEIRGRKFDVLYIDGDDGRERAVHSTKIFHRLIFDYSLPWVRLEYKTRNVVDCNFYLPSYPRKDIVTDKEVIQSRVTQYFNQLGKELDCTQHLKFNIHFLSDESILRDSSKSKKLVVTVKSRRPSDGISGSLIA